MKASTRAKEKYNSKNYERITFRVKKGEKELIEIAAERLGISVNRFICDCVRMGQLSPEKMAGVAGKGKAESKMFG